LLTARWIFTELVPLARQLICERFLEVVVQSVLKRGFLCESQGFLLMRVAVLRQVLNIILHFVWN